MALIVLDLGLLCFAAFFVVAVVLCLNERVYRWVSVRWDDEIFFFFILAPLFGSFLLMLGIVSMSLGL